MDDTGNTVENIVKNTAESRGLLKRLERFWALLGAPDNRAISIAVILSLALIICGVLFGTGLVRMKRADRFVSVRGSAERDVTANKAVWALEYSEETADNQISAQAKIDRDTGVVRAFFARAGFPAQALHVAYTRLSVNEHEDKDNNGNVVRRWTGYQVTQRVTLATTDIDRAQSLTDQVGTLLSQGVPLADSSGVSFYYTKIAEIKPQLIDEATINARKAASKFADDSGSTLGVLKRASQDPLSLDGDGGSSPNMNVRVVAHLDYYLK